MKWIFFKIIFFASLGKQNVLFIVFFYNFGRRMRLSWKAEKSEYISEVYE